MNRGLSILKVVGGGKEIGKLVFDHWPAEVVVNWRPNQLLPDLPRGCVIDRGENKESVWDAVMEWLKDNNFEVLRSVEVHEGELQRLWEIERKYNELLEIIYEDIAHSNEGTGAVEGEPSDLVRVWKDYFFTGEW